MTEAATLRRSPPGAQAGLVLLLLALAGAAWALSDQRMGGMAAAPGSELGGLGWFAVTWLTMMAAMMLPAATPMVVAYSQRPASVGAVPAFVAGYLVSWLAAGLVGYGVVEGVRSLELGFLAWDEAGRYVVAAVILAAALYQLSSPKDACLSRCGEPRRFFAEHWRPGRLGALRMGMEHGGFCAGCCWALMAALFALGVMSLGWMAFVATLIIVERLLPWREHASRGVALVLALLALGVALAPEEVPGLSVPGPGSMDSMEMR
jgi:predicted metal-binding membrane protein